ncbi:carbohydrate ABC transporter permease [Tessaracoccus defluvii]|uniref:Carbohydrate ABC transporter permease n=1 Tax=Tessaracoccus defluvii TaxID=1285901 RepID=A0A7H0H576_9ACTN|nr:carbohydrate ABC transporter permease [Tessaracoccus defluvii]QNP55692.1 carbohydrate ABC transporter permease [Tessaracoccus defluvii]
MKKRMSFGGVFLTVFTVFSAIIVLLPVVWALAVSLKREGSQIGNSINWFLPPYTLENYPRVLLGSDVIIWVYNSTLVAVLSTALTLVVTPLAAYAIAKIGFRGRGILYIYFMLGMMIPVEAMIIPLFVTTNSFGLVDTYPGLLLPGIAVSMNLIIMVAFMRQIPNELIEAARIDGAGYWRIFWHVVLPLSKTIMITVGIFSFTGSWNNYLWPLLVSMNSNMFTLPIGIPTFAGTYTIDRVLPMTANMVASLPMIVLFILLERFIVKGVSMTGIKG